GAADAGTAMATVHTLGGTAMMEAAARAAGESLALVGVTVLTSHDPVGYDRALGRHGTVLDDEVVRLGAEAMAAGLAGVVCSPREVPLLRPRLGLGPRIVVPGIRRAADAAGDQVRTATPAEAVRNGATHLVVGRPIIAAADPAAAWEAIRQEMG